MTMADLRRFVSFPVALVVLALVAPAVWAAAPTAGTPPSGGGDGSQVQSDLLWLMAGLQQLDKEPGLRLAKKQAADILAVLKPLVDRKLVLLDPPAQRSGPGQGAPGAGSGGANFQNMTPKQREQFRKRRETRAAKLRAAMAAIDKILSPKQVEFIDNMDFDPSPYVFAGDGLGSGNGSGAPPAAAQIEQFRTKARETLTRATALTRKTYELLQARAAGK